MKRVKLRAGEAALRTDQQSGRCPRAVPPKGAQRLGDRSPASGLVGYQQSASVRPEGDQPVQGNRFGHLRHRQPAALFGGLDRVGAQAVGVDGSRRCDG